MYEDIIQQMVSSCIEEFEKHRNEFYAHPDQLAEFIEGLKVNALRMAIRYATAALEDCDQMYRDSPTRRARGWEIVRRDGKCLITSIGEVRFKKTLFLNKNTGERCYLIDRTLGLEKGQRMTEDAVAEVLKEAVESSYRKGGEHAGILCKVSKSAVMDEIHNLTFESEKEKVTVTEKRKVEYLFIDADEDHVALQFKEKKGDLSTNEHGQKSNTEIAKLAYVYEGVERVAPKSKRHRLINPYYFSGVYKGSKNEQFWEEVFAYIERTYDLDYVKKIYLGADGGVWIKGASDKISDLVYVLDEFHMQKYLLKIVRHLYDSADDVRRELRGIIQDGTKEAFRSKVDEIKEYAESESQRERIEEGASYILTNWAAAKTRLNGRELIRGCSAEGHVSHVLSSRMSSRPMGWCTTGVDKMAHLRAYYYNGGSMLELVRKQPKKQEMKKAAGAEEEVILSASEMLSWENRHRKENGKYFDSMQMTVSSEAAKYAWFKGHVTGL